MTASIFRACLALLRLCLGLSLVPGILSPAMVAGAAGFISVPAAGIGPLNFNLVANPAPTNGFSTQSIGGLGNSINDTNSMNLAVPTNEIANINLILPQSNTLPPTTQAFARYNYGGFFLQTRPAGNAYTILLATFRNDTGSDRSQILLTYDQGFAQSGGTEQVPGLWVYYSLTGAAGTWQKLDALSGREGTFSMATRIRLSNTWEVGANLYILWADDNSDGFTDGNFTIDNLSIDWDGCDLPIVVQPHDITIESCRSSNLTVTASGAGPITYQWYKGSLSNPIPGATGSSLNFFNAQLTDAGTYFVVVTGPFCGSVESTHVTVTVNEDVVQPVVLSAIGLTYGTNVVVTFSEPMFAPTTGNSGSYRLHPISAGSDIIPLSARLNAAGTILTLSFGEARAAGIEYELIIDGSVTDACGNPLTTDRTPLWYEVLVMPLTNTTWKYNAEGQNLGTDWYDANYDVSTWQTGLSLLDGKQETTGFTPTPRTTVNGQEVLTQLPQRLSSGPYATSNIPVYYFRSSFTLPVSLSHVKGLRLRPFVDDFDIVYLNGNGTPAHMNPGNPQSDINFFGYPGGTPVADADFAGPYDVNVTNLVEGTNLIAVKLYQASIGSSDITLGYEILAVVDTLGGIAPGPQLSVSEDPGTGTITLTWTPGTGSALYESDSLTAPVGTWSLVTGASDGSYSFTPPTTGGTQKFYSLRK